MLQNGTLLKELLVPVKMIIYGTVLTDVLGLVEN